jgi:hypothetical protein
MQRRTPLLDAFEAEEARRSPPDLHRGLAIVEALLAEARALGVWPPPDPLGGLDVDLRLARALRVHRAAGEDRNRI